MGRASLMNSMPSMFTYVYVKIYIYMGDARLLWNNFIYSLTELIDIIFKCFLYTCKLGLRNIFVI